MLMGEYNYTIDDKGRLNFPAKFREKMGAAFVVTRWLDDCLVAFPETEWQRITGSNRMRPCLSGVTSWAAAKRKR